MKSTTIGSLVVDERPVEALYASLADLPAHGDERDRWSPSALMEPHGVITLWESHNFRI